MWLRRLLISQQECRSIWNPHVINSDKACGGYYFWRLLSSFFLDPHLNKPGRYKTGHDVIALREKKRKGGLELTATQFILPWEVDSEKYNWQWERIGRVLSMEWQKYKSPTPLLPLPPPSQKQQMMTGPPWLILFSMQYFLIWRGKAQVIQNISFITDFIYFKLRKDTRYFYFKLSH